jgi:hypothetical protein
MSASKPMLPMTRMSLGWSTSSLAEMGMGVPQNLHGTNRLTQMGQDTRGRLLQCMLTLIQLTLLIST